MSHKRIKAPRGRVPGLGATGDYPEGKICPDDEGALNLGVAADCAHGVVRIEFGEPIAWFGLPADDAERFAALILDKVRELRQKPQ